MCLDVRAGWQSLLSLGDTDLKISRTCSNQKMQQFSQDPLLKLLNGV